MSIYYMNSDGLSQLSSLIYNDFKNVNSKLLDAYDKANSAYSLVSDAYNTANSAYSQANSAYSKANGASTTASSAYTQANSAYNKANSAYSLASSAKPITFSGGYFTTDSNGCVNLRIYLGDGLFVLGTGSHTNVITTQFLQDSYWYVSCKYKNGVNAASKSVYIVYTYTNIL